MFLSRWPLMRRAWEAFLPFGCFVGLAPILIQLRHLASGVIHGESLKGCTSTPGPSRCKRMYRLNTDRLLRYFDCSSLRRFFLRWIPQR